MDIQNDNLEEDSNDEETDGNNAEDGQFMNYENSVFRLRKQKGKKMSPEQMQNEQTIFEKERENKIKALKTEKLLELIRSHKNKITMWQSFAAGNDQHAVVFCYERDYLKAWMNLQEVSFGDNYQLTLTENEIKLNTEEKKNCCKEDMQGVSHTGTTRTYRVPRAIDYYRAVWHQTGDVLEICVPWRWPLM